MTRHCQVTLRPIPKSCRPRSWTTWPAWSGQRLLISVAYTEGAMSVPCASRWPEGDHTQSWGDAKSGSARRARAAALGRRPQLHGIHHLL